MNDPTLPDELEPTADAVRQALTSRAAETEPGPDAYARLATRVASADASPRRTLPWSAPRLAAAATAGLALVAAGFGIATLADDDPAQPGLGQVETADGGTDTTDDAATTTTVAPGATTTPSSIEVPPRAVGHRAGTGHPRHGV